MRWHRLILTSVVGCTFLGGCESSRLQTADLPQPPGVARSQDADSPPKSRPRMNYLDSLPDQPADAVSGEAAARIAATVNGYPIFEEEIEANMLAFKRVLDSLPEPERTQKRREIYKELLDQLIEREVLIQDALSRLKKAGPSVMAKLQEAAEKEFDRRWVKSMKENNGIKSDDDLKEMLRRQGLSLEMIRRQWTRQFISTEYLRNRVMTFVEKIGHEHLQEYYEQHPEEFKIDDSVEWLDLFISATNPKYHSRQEAQAAASGVANRIRNGEDFLTLCKQVDDGDSILRNAEGIGKKRGEIQPTDCEEHLFDMAPGEVGAVEIGSGYHVFKVLKRERAGKRPFNIDVQKEIKGKLRAAIYEREVKKLVKDLRDKAIIEYSHRLH